MRDILTPKVMKQFGYLAEKDFEEVVEFLNQTMPYDRFTIESLREQTTGDPDYEPQLALIARRERIEGFILGICREDLGGIKVFSLRDNKDSEEIGTRLLEKLEEKFIKEGMSKVQVGHIPPKYFQPGIDARYTAVAAILLKKGYQVEGTAQTMEVDLTVARLDTTEEEKRLKEEGIIVKRLDEKDKEAYIYFLKGWSSIWFYFGMLAYNNKPISCHIAIQKNKVVGFACYGMTGNNHFGPIGVDPKMRGRGMGEVLLKRCLKDIKLIGNKKAIIGAVGPVYFYWKTVGARIPRLLWRMGKELRG